MGIVLVEYGSKKVRTGNLLSFKKNNDTLVLYLVSSLILSNSKIFYNEYILLS